MFSETYHVGSNTKVTILPEFGCNLCSWVMDGQELLYFPKSWDESRPFCAGGNPILFPSVGRTWDRRKKEPVANRYFVHGIFGEFEMPLHGLALMGKWHKEREEICKEIVEVEYSYSIPEDMRVKYFPFELTLSLLYRIFVNSITMRITFENRGRNAAPFAFGLHPFFNVNTKKNIKIELPCTKNIILDPNLLIPVGEETLNKATFFLEENKRYDNVFGGITDRYASIVDTQTGSKLKITVDESIEYFVLSAKANLNYVCLEPWTKGLGCYEKLSKSNWQEQSCFNILDSGQQKTINLSYSFDQCDK